MLSKELKKEANRASKLVKNLPSWCVQGGGDGWTKTIARQKKKIKKLKARVKELETERDKAWMVIY
jgi:hypothetical protein